MRPLMAPLFRAAFLWVLLTSPFPVAARHLAPVEEIEHLLVYIEQSGCAFIRNGREHSAAEARAHIEKKYSHVRDRVETAEEWIEYAAARSSLSGRPYRVLCNSAEMSSADWLRAELEKFRSE